MKIRRIVIQDLTAISSLYVSVFSSPPWNEYWEYNWAHQRLRWIYNNRGFKGYVAEAGTTILGAILGYSIPFRGEKGFNILEFFVAAENQQQGIGSQLCAKIELELKNCNYSFINLLTAKSSQAESFYLSKGYQINRQLELLNKKI